MRSEEENFSRNRVDSIDHEALLAQQRRIELEPAGHKLSADPQLVQVDPYIDCLHEARLQKLDEQFTFWKVIAHFVSVPPIYCSADSLSIRTSPRLP